MGAILRAVYFWEIAGGPDLTCKLARLSLVLGEATMKAGNETDAGHMVGNAVPLAIWSIVETNCYTIAVCLPHMRPILRPLHYFLNDTLSMLGVSVQRSVDDEERQEETSTKAIVPNPGPQT